MSKIFQKYATFLFHKTFSTDNDYIYTHVKLLRLLSIEYPWERHEPFYSPNYALNIITAVFTWIALPLNNIQRLICH